MVPLTSWFRSSPGRGVSAGKRDQAENVVAFQARQREDLQDAMQSIALIMNDDLDSALEALQQGNSSFHSFGVALTSFMRSVLGFEHKVMADTAARLAECEAAATADYKTIQRHGPSLATGRAYPPGTEYDLVRAQAHLLGAVVGVLSESVVEAMRAFYKLRKAFLILDAIVAMKPSTLVNEGGHDWTAKGPADVEMNRHNSDSSDDSEVFADGQETWSAGQTSPTGAESGSSSMTTASAPSGDLCPDSAKEQPPPLGRLNALALDDSAPGFEDPLDEFVHSGTSLCFGMLLLMLSLVPPSYSRILSVVGFRGDRAEGVRLLWRSAAHQNVHGALAGMVLLGYYNGLLGAADVVPGDADADGSGDSMGPPRKRCAALLAEMRARFPSSQLWQIEEARLLSSRRRLGEALDVLRRGSDRSRMRQLTALKDFELAMCAMMAQDWVLMRDSFFRCQESSDWSPAMYSYSAGCALLELYRDAAAAGSSEEQKAALRAEAETQLRKAPKLVGRKRFMARQLPLETFLQRKVARWEERARELGIDLVDAVGTSPAQELCHVWGGHHRMGEAELERALQCLDEGRITAEGKAGHCIRGDEVESGTRAVCMAALLRSQGKLSEAREVLQKDVFAHDWRVFKGANKDDYVVPEATHELAAIAWAESCQAQGSEAAAYRRERLDECEAQLDKARGWREPFPLEARLGMRVQCGLETVRWLRRKLERGEEDWPTLA